jgi:hypothetical protein
MIRKDELTLTEEEIDELTADILGWSNDLLFQSKANRDAVYNRARKNSDLPLRRSSISNQQLDPRYTVEGRHQPDRGLANDYRHWFPTLYMLESR